MTYLGAMATDRGFWNMLFKLPKVCLVFFIGYGKYRIALCINLTWRV